MLRTNKQPKFYNDKGTVGNYPMPGNRGTLPIRQVAPSSLSASKQAQQKQWTFGRIVYWIFVALISKRILENVIFLASGPSLASNQDGSNAVSSSLQTYKQPSALSIPKQSPIRSPVAPASAPVAEVKPKPVATVAKATRTLKNTAAERKDSHEEDDDDGKDSGDGDDDDDDKAGNQKDAVTEPPTPTPFDPSNWKVVFDPPHDESKERKICFITCSYASSSNDMDPLVIVENHNPKFVRFYLFSNLNDNEWHTPGWNKIVTQYNYTRVITHSRYGKFMAWKYPEIQDNCEAVFYMDSVLRPSPNKTYWDSIANYMLKDNYEEVMAHKNQYSPEEIKNTITNNATNWGNLTKYLMNATGFMQHNHDRNRTGIYNEIQAIQWAKKDFKKNVKALMNWFRGQPEGFDWYTPVYLCTAFGYNPKSRVFQMVANSFWEHYSLEVDSWRDQPLWAYMLRRYLVRPTIFPYPQDTLWEKLRLEDFGHGNHEYLSEADVKMPNKK